MAQPVAPGCGIGNSCQCSATARPSTRPSRRARSPPHQEQQPVRCRRQQRRRQAAAIAAARPAGRPRRRTRGKPVLVDAHGASIHPPAAGALIQITSCALPYRPSSPSPRCARKLPRQHRSINDVAPKTAELRRAHQGRQGAYHASAEPGHGVGQRAQGAACAGHLLPAGAGQRLKQAEAWYRNAMHRLGVQGHSACAMPLRGSGWRPIWPPVSRWPRRWVAPAWTWGTAMGGGGGSRWFICGEGKGQG